MNMQNVEESLLQSVLLLRFGLGQSLSGRQLTCLACAPMLNSLGWERRLLAVILVDMFALVMDGCFPFHVRRFRVSNARCIGSEGAVMGDRAPPQSCVSHTGMLQ